MKLDLLLFLVMVNFGSPVPNRGYLITTPGKWMKDRAAQICFSLTDGKFAAKDELTVTLSANKTDKKSVGLFTFKFRQGENNICESLPIEWSGFEAEALNAAIEGVLGGRSITERANITVMDKTALTFIQTDKYLYLPGQTVQFRVLTVEGPSLTVNKNKYEEVYVHSPSGTRIQQWLKVENLDGLVHLSFNLSKEAEEGLYTIFTKKEGKSSGRNFEVEDYVLPRYEVTIEAPMNILGSDSAVTLTLCARYTNGEPVKGEATFSLASGTYQVYSNITQNKPISGCTDFKFPTNLLLFEHNNCHINVNNLVASAIVEETGTGVVLSARNDQITVHRQVLQFKDISPTTVNKPYLPYTVKLAVTYNDGKPAKNEAMKVCTTYQDENICKNFNTSEKGHLSFVLPSHFTESVQVRAVNYQRIERNWNDVMEESQYLIPRFASKRYFDSSNSSLTIFNEEEIKCTSGQNISVKIPVVYISTEKKELTDIYIQVISKGYIKILNNTQVKFEDTCLPFEDDELIVPLEKAPRGTVRGAVSLSLVFPPLTASKLKLLVWYKTSSGGVVADSRELDVSDCLPHKVDLSWSDKKREPGADTKLKILGANNALCSIGVVDKSVELISSQNDYFSIESLLNFATSFEIHQWDVNQLNIEYCIQKYGSASTSARSQDISVTTKSCKKTMTRGRTPRNSLPIYYGGTPVEAIKMFNQLGIIAMSNLVLEEVNCKEIITNALEEDSGVYATSPQKIFRGGINRGGINGGGSYEQQDEGYQQITEDDVKAVERSYLPETWLWLLQPLSATGEWTKSLTLPDTITEWVGRAVCVHPSEGVGISPSASITTFTPFFVDLTLPATMTKGEVLPLKISIFNYLDGAIPVKVLLKPSSDYTFISGLNATESGEREICIPSKSKSVQTIKIEFNTLGDVNITVLAYSEALTSGTCGSGVPPKKRDKLTKSLQINPEGYQREKTYSKYICSQDATIKPEEMMIEAPTGVVPGSARAWITVSGDLMGLAVENLNSLIKRPIGSGEQNMIKIAPNIYILEYLESSKKTTDDIKRKIKKILNEGYQKQMKFRHDDGSFSAFGVKDISGSTFLTAFVVKSFFPLKRYINVDAKLLSQSIGWLKKLQNKDGCYRIVGKSNFIKIDGGMGETGRYAPLLTAYVLAALLETGNVTQEISSSAIRCIQKNNSTHPYNRALKGYALALAKSPDAKTIIDGLIKSAASNDTFLRWDVSDGRGKKYTQVV